MRSIVILFFLFFFINAFAEEKKDSLNAAAPKENVKDSAHKAIQLEGYLDINYAWDNNKPINNIRLYNSNPLHVNQFNLAYTYAQIAYNHKHYKAVVALHTGGIVDLMYAGEDYLIKFVRELSFKWYVNKSIALETGIMPSVYGMETFISRDNYNAARLIMTDFAPDYEMGLRLHYKVSEHWKGLIQVTNGWQVIRDNNRKPGYGMVNYYETKRLHVNWGLYAGQEPYKDKAEQWRFYSNLFAKIYAGRFTFVPLFDYGMLQNPYTKKYDTWQCYGLVTRYAFTNKWAAALRYERVFDPHHIIPELYNTDTRGFRLHDGTATLEYIPIKNIVLRLEGRYSYSPYPTYTTHSATLSKQDLFVMLAAHITINNH